MSEKMRVLRETNLNEADKILTVLTHEKGKISVLCKNVRRIKSRFAAGAHFLCYSDFVIDPGRNMYFLRQCEPCETFYKISEDIEKLALATYLGQLTAEIVPDETDSDQALSMLLNTFYVLCNAEKDLRLVKAVYELRLMSDQGFTPAVLGCEACGEKLFPMEFDAEKGCIYCAMHKNGKGFPLSEDGLNAIYYILFSPLKKLFSFTLSKELTQNLASLAEYYVLYRTDKPLKSLEYLKSLW